MTGGMVRKGRKRCMALMAVGVRQSRFFKKLTNACLMFRNWNKMFVTDQGGACRRRMRILGLHMTDERTNHETWNRVGFANLT